MKRMILLAVLVLGLLSVVTGGPAGFGVTVVSAQIMGREYTPPLYECEDDFGKYESSFPCDMEAEACVCKTCHTQVPCDEMDAHKKTHDEEDRPGESMGECHLSSYWWCRGRRQWRRRQHRQFRPL